MKRIPLLTIFLCFLATLCLAAPVNLNNLTTAQKQLIDEHVYGGLPGRENIYIRNGYVLSFNPQTRTPDGVAYHVVLEYRKI